MNETVEARSAPRIKYTPDGALVSTFLTVDKPQHIVDF